MITGFTILWRTLEKSMRISIIISVFNCLELTRKCLSTLEATLPAGLDYELILIDDGSTDGSRDFFPEYARSRPQCRVILNEQNLRYARSNNRGAAAATGTHLLFLNNDTELTPGWIEPMIAGYRHLRGKRPGIIGNVQRRFSDGKIDHAGVFVNARAKPDHLQLDPAQAYPKHAYSEHTAATGACILMSAAVFREVGGFDEEFQNGGEDMDLNFKVRHAGYRVFVANRSCIGHHVSASPSRNDHHERNTRRVFSKWRAFLLHEGAKTWAKDYASAPERKGTWWQDPLYRQSLALKQGWTKRIPQPAIDAVDALICEQEAVWETMFGEEETHG
jgi:O-antigen biosynthesis protein